MQEKKKSNKILLVILVILLIALFISVLFYKKKININDIIDDVKKEEINENYNGIYEYKEDLNGTRNFFYGCSLSYISNQILIINDDFYRYRSSCVGTYLEEKGKVENLNLKYNEEAKKYYIVYKDKNYIKGYQKNIILGTKYDSDSQKKIYAKDYDMFLREIEHKTNHMDLPPQQLNDLSNGLHLKVKYTGKDSFDLDFGYVEKGVFYNVYHNPITDMNLLPKAYPYGDLLVLIEHETSKNKYNYNIVVIDGKDTVYRLNNYLPIVVNDRELTKNDSIFIGFDQRDKDFKMIVSSTIPDKDSTESYFLFSIKYDYKIKNFAKPEFIKRGTIKNDFVYLNKIIGGKI